MGAADRAREHHHDDRSRRHRRRTAARLIPDRPRPHRAAALRLSSRSRTSPIRGRCPKPTPSPAPSPTSSTPWSRPSSEHPPRARPRRPAVVDRQPLPPRRRPRRSANSTTTRRPRSAARSEQDGSEIRSVELERLIAEGISLIERRNAFELFRDHAADLLRTPHRLAVASARRIDGQPPHADRRR